MQIPRLSTGDFFFNMEKLFDVIIIGGSVAGLSTALTLGRALRNVVVIDCDSPCNQYTPESHNFFTRDGESPQALLSIARQQLQQYDNITFLSAKASAAEGQDGAFQVTAGDKTVKGRKVVLATGLRDLFPEIDGFESCWGKSVLHCPYCHGYEVRDRPTAVLANGEAAYHLGTLIHNWTKKLTVLTNGVSELRAEEQARLESFGITINERNIKRFFHHNGVLSSVVFDNEEQLPIEVIYASIPFEQQSDLCEQLGCKISSHHHIEVDDEQRTSIKGVFAVGDCTAQPRAISVASASGTKAGFTINLELMLEEKMPSDK